MDTIGKRIRAARLAGQWGLTEAAKRAKISPAAWSRYESGGRTPRVDILQRMAAAIGVKVEELIGN